MNTSSNQRCGHPACRCTVPGGEACCSGHCRKRVESPTTSEPGECQCGHPACTGTRAGGGKTS
ncbi:hypothetical protein ASG87_06445 [Frateuria sp. Soil773]|nr:hypothetical protein ASG87_06445 [Frateuria sp. Soil773]